MQLKINGEIHEVDVEPDMPLLWVLRDVLNMTGTKFGCGMGLCGACTVHMDGTPVRSCVLPVMALEGVEVSTIDKLSHPVQEAWLEQQTPQCGYCQSGQLMAAAGLLNGNAKPSDADIDNYMTNLCRCASYQRIRKGIHATRMPEPAPAPVEAPVAPAAPEGGAQ